MPPSASAACTCRRRTWKRVTDDGLVGRVESERAFAALEDRLVRRGVVAVVVGGVAMIGIRFVADALDVCSRSLLSATAEAL